MVGIDVKMQKSPSGAAVSGLFSFMLYDVNNVNSVNSNTNDYALLTQLHARMALATPGHPSSSAYEERALVSLKL